MRFLYFLSLVPCFLAAVEIKPPHPVTKYWITILITLEVTQKRARPLGNCKVIKTNNSGISHSIILPCACCLGSAVGVIVIFCCTHMAAPTRIGSISILSGTARFNHRNLSLKGTIEYAMSHE